jgi:hypothetical protein
MSGLLLLISFTANCCHAATGVFYYTPGVLNNSYTLTSSSAASSAVVKKIAGALTSIDTTYILNTNPMNFDASQAYCNDMGGHLVSYGSSQEQVRAARQQGQRWPPSAPCECWA